MCIRMRMYVLVYMGGGKTLQSVYDMHYIYFSGVWYICSTFAFAARASALLVLCASPALAALAATEATEASPAQNSYF